MLSYFSISIGSTLTIEAMFIEYIVVVFNAHKFIDVENGPENKTVFKKVQFVIMQLDSLLSKDLLIGHTVFTQSPLSRKHLSLFYKALLYQRSVNFLSHNDLSYTTLLLSIVSY